MNQNWITRGQHVILNTYSQFPLAIEKGEGVYLFDVEGNQYLDFVSGIAVNALGYQHPAQITALREQISSILHVSNLYWIPPAIELAELITSHSGFNKVFFCNSGTEANEAAIKCSRKYGKLHHGKECVEIISMTQSFHGRTLASLSLTGQLKYRKDFEPLLSGVSYAEFNDFEDVRSQVSHNTCAIIIEPIQGEGGIIPATKEFLTQVRTLCTKNDILLIFDEVQCGIGRSGKLFAHQLFGVQPDIITLAKGLGGGLPIGAMAVVESIASILKPGDHASTFGGNYLSCVSGVVVLKELLENHLLTQISENGNYLKAKLLHLMKKTSLITHVRGFGLMQGIELSISPKSIISQCIEQGLLLVGAGKNVIRFVPPLIVSKSEIDQALEILEDCLLKSDIQVNEGQQFSKTP